MIVSAWYGGLGPGLLAMALAITGVDYFLISPVHSLVLIGADSVQLVVFSLVSLALLYEQMQQLKLRTAELVASQTQMQTILEYAPGFICINGLDGRLQFANARWKQLFAQIENPVGRYLSEVFTPEQTANFLRQNQSVAAAGKAMTFEEEVVLPEACIPTSTSSSRSRSPVAWLMLSAVSR